jgi:hypothetical protein
MLAAREVIRLQSTATKLLSKLLAIPTEWSAMDYEQYCSTSQALITGLLEAVRRSVLPESPPEIAKLHAILCFLGGHRPVFSKNASKSMICSDSDDLELGSGPRPSPFIYGGSLLSIEVKPVFALADSWKPQRTPHSLAESHRTLPDKCHGE